MGGGTDHQGAVGMMTIGDTLEWTHRTVAGGTAAVRVTRGEAETTETGVDGGARMIGGMETETEMILAMGNEAEA